MNIKEYKDSFRTLMYIVILTTINYIFPFLSMIVMFLWPVPIVYLVQKEESSRVIAVIASAALINGFFFGAVMGLITVIGFGLVGFIIGNIIKEGFSPLKTLIAAVLSVIVSQALVVYVSGSIMDLNYQLLIEEAIRNLGGEFDGQSVEQLVIPQLQFIKLMFPALLGISATITAIFNYYISAWYLRRRGLNIEIYKPFNRWYLPRWIVSILIIISLLMRSNTIFLNINIYLFFLSFLQGFSVLMYYLSTKSSSFLLKAFVVFLIFLFPPVPIVLMLLGLLDMWFNFRKQDEQPG